jgi:hypothetical protein
MRTGYKHGDVHRPSAVVFRHVESNQDHDEVLKVLLRQRGLHTDGFTLYTTEWLIDANIQDGMFTRAIRAGVSLEGVDDDQEAFPLLARDRWLGGSVTRRISGNGNS